MTETRIVHADLEVEGDLEGATQPVEVELLPDGHLRVLYTPGFVEGIAAVDTIRVVNETLGRFEILARGGNVAVKFAAPELIADVLPQITAKVEALGGRFDGAIERAAVWTIPCHAGFTRIEEAMNHATSLIPGAQWWYGNVYDEAGRPLNWWESG